MQKDFDSWNEVKKKLEGADPLLFKEREVWWCHIGVNLGYEIIGKNSAFSRPVLILKKHNAHTFFGLPLTTTQKTNPLHYFPVHFNHRDGSIVLSQGRAMSSKRLSDKMGRISENTFERIKHAYKQSF